MVQRVSSGAPLEQKIGFSRAVRAGHLLVVAGTAPLAADGTTHAVGDPYRQAARCIEIARQAIEQAGATLENVVRTRILLTEISHWEQVARAHGEAFGAIRPACTVMEVGRFIDPDWLVEIEMDCLIGE